MVSTNPMFRNTPTAQERNKMRTSGMGLNTVRDITGRASDFRTPMGPINPLDQFGTAQRQAADQYGAARMSGGSGADPLARATQLQPLAFAEDNTNFVDGQATPRGLGQGMPMPSGNPSGFRARMAPPEPDPFAPGSGYQATDPSDPFFSPRPRRAQRFNVGGTLVGPGGPMDDMIPGVIDGKEGVALSNGEEVTDALTRDYFGKKHFLKMRKEAHEAMAEMPATGQNPPVPKSPMQMPLDLDAETGMPIPGFRYGGTMPMKEYNEGGTMISPSFAQFVAMKEAQNANPEMIARREQEARDQRLAAIGGADFGGGRAGFRNQYGSGYFMPDTAPLRDMSDGSMMRNVGTRTRPRLESIPDPVSGPWGTGGAMPDMVSAADRRAAIDETLASLQAEAPRRRAADIAGAQNTRPNPFTPIPAWAMMPAPGTAAAPRQPFLSPSEKDAQAREARANAMPTERDMMAGMTGMQKRRFRAQMAVGQAQQQQQLAAEQQKALAQRQFMPAIDATTGQPIPGRLVSGTGQQMNLDGTQSKAPKMQPAAAKALLTSPQASTLDANTLAEITADTRYDLATRELARRQLAKAPAADSKVTPRGVPRKEGELFYNFMSDGTRQPVRIPNPTPQEKFAYFKQLTGKDANFTAAQMTPEDWTEAHYLTTGDPRPARSAAPAAAGQSPSFASEAEALRAGFKGIALINGRRARID